MDYDEQPVTSKPGVTPLTHYLLLVSFYATTIVTKEFHDPYSNPARD